MNILNEWECFRSRFRPSSKINVQTQKSRADEPFGKGQRLYYVNVCWLWVSTEVSHMNPPAVTLRLQAATEIENKRFQSCFCVCLRLRNYKNILLSGINVVVNAKWIHLTSDDPSNAFLSLLSEKLPSIQQQSKIELSTSEVFKSVL